MRRTLRVFNLSAEGDERQGLVQRLFLSALTRERGASTATILAISTQENTSACGFEADIVWGSAKEGS